MLKKTNKAYRNQVIYSIYVRNHSEKGNFDSIKDDLDRIQKLGVDIIWFLPIHPIGQIDRIGALGSPYAIKDFRAVNSEYGTSENFESLVHEIHKRNMKCIIDVVFNHTSPDSWLVNTYPEWFYRKADGSFGNKIGEWPDVIDLDYSQRELWDYQIETLKQWAQIVDGFRCDVAPLLPLEFWLLARREVETVRPGCIWLAESVEPIFTIENRARGLISLSDSELYQAFDICYDYDIFSYFRGYLEGRHTLEEYVEKINQQEAIYADDYIKLRYLENHDQARARAIISDEVALRNWTAFIYFQKGMTLLYGGQEAGDDNRPNLFNKDLVQWDKGLDLSDLMAKMYTIKKHPMLTSSRYKVRAMPNEVIYATHFVGDCSLNGIFSVMGQKGVVKVEVPDGSYKNLIDDTKVDVQNGTVICSGDPIIFEAPNLENSEKLV